MYVHSASFTEIQCWIKLQRNVAKNTIDMVYTLILHALNFSLSFLSLCPSIHLVDRKWPGSVGGAEHDRKPALSPHWCDTHYGPLINNLVPFSLMSLHHRAANIQANHNLMTHDITSVCVCGSIM